MAGHQSRMSVYSSSSIPMRGNNSNPTQLSTTTLLNALHTCYHQERSYTLESSTSVVVNSWLTASSTGQDDLLGGTVDVDLARKAWEHARRRAEDACIILA